MRADEQADTAILSRVGLGDLAKRGRTELVSVVLPLIALKTKDYGPEVRKTIGPLGQVTVQEKSNRLILQDTAGNLRRIIEAVRDVEFNPGKRGTGQIGP